MSSEQNNNRTEESAHSMEDSVNRSFDDKIKTSSSKNSSKSEHSAPLSEQDECPRNLLQLNSMNSSQNSAHNSSNNLLHHQSQQNLSTVPSASDHSHLSPNISALDLDLPPSRETYKSRKKIYQQEKKKLAEQMLSTLNDPTVIVLADWLKARTKFKAWTKVWCELRPGLLVIYKSSKTHKSSNWIGTVLLNICSVIERPSKKGGFCFKIFSQSEQNIWSKQGPKGELYAIYAGALTPALPTSYLMFRASSQVAGNRWIKAINLSFQSSKQMIRNDLHSNQDSKLNTEIFNRLLDDEDINVLKDEHEIEREHFIDQDLTDDQNSSAEHEYNRSSDSDTTGSIEDNFTSRHLESKQNAAAKQHQSDEKLDKQSTIKKQPPQRTNRSGQEAANLSSQLSSQSSHQDAKTRSRQLITLKKSPSDISLSDQLIDQTEYVYRAEDHRFGEEHSQGEDVGEENKSLLWSLLKQVRPGDLSKVVLPTFILEPRSFLEKLTDYYYHCYILASASNQNDPFERMKEVVKWYLSGLYKKPQGLKKPYNPILGETFRCFWHHPSSSDSQASSDQLTKTFYVAEQISHHPPISAFHCVNRNQGYLVSGVVQVQSSFYGNSVSAILNGNVRLSLINRGESYAMNYPYAHCSGILFGGLTFELGGKAVK